MARAIQRYLDSEGNEFLTEAEADASDAFMANRAEIDAFVDQHFPTKPGSKRGNPHAGTARNAICLWIGYKKA